MRFVRSIAASRLRTAAAVFVGAVLPIAVAVVWFGLTVAGAIALYFIVWWTLLFAVLPFGVRSQAQTGDVLSGSEPGAPSVPALGEKTIWTTLIASLVFIATAALLPLSGL